MNNDRCANCGSTLRDGIPFCLACGALSSLVWPMECENHIDEKAVGVCTVCGKPVCGDCAVSIDGKVFCDHRDHQSIPGQWEIVCSTDFEFEADLIERNLQQSGFECKVFSLSEHVGTYWESHLHFITVLVKKDRFRDALELLKELDLVPKQSS